MLVRIEVHPTNPYECSIGPLNNEQAAALCGALGLLNDGMEQPATLRARVSWSQCGWQSICLWCQPAALLDPDVKEAPSA